MVLTVFSVLLLAHILADFVLQSDEMAASKQDIKDKGGVKSLLLHALWVFLTAAAALLLVRPPDFLSLACAGVVAVWHLALDFVKSLIRHGRRRTLLLAADQLLHAAGLYAAAWLLGPSAKTGEALLQIRLPGLVAALPLLETASGLCVLFGVAFGGAAFVKNVLLDLRILPQAEEPQPPASAGKWIGILERLAGMLLAAWGQWAAFGLLVAAKSVARHRQMEDRRYAEYFLIGTLLSMLLAIGGGWLLGRLWQ